MHDKELTETAQIVMCMSKLSLPTTQYTRYKISSVLLTWNHSTTVKHAGINWVMCTVISLKCSGKLTKYLAIAKYADSSNDLLCMVEYLLVNTFLSTATWGVSHWQLIEVRYRGSTTRPRQPKMQLSNVLRFTQVRLGGSLNSRILISSFVQCGEQNSKTTIHWVFGVFPHFQICTYIHKRCNPWIDSGLEEILPAD